MRFIVDVYRLIILAFMAIVLIAGAYLITTVSTAGSGGAAWGAATIFGFILALVAIVLVLGITATFVSMHDRLCELAEQSKRIADSLEWANRSKYDASAAP